MQDAKGKLKICSRGHRFYRSNKCPICPKCWPGFYRKPTVSDLPEKLGAPALRALMDAKIMGLTQLSKYTESEVSSMHGIGPNALKELREALKEKHLSFRKT